MNRVVVPVVAVVLAAAAGLSGLVAGPQTPPAPSQTASSVARTTVACPADKRASADVIVSAAAGDGLTSSPLANPDQTTAAESSELRLKATGSLRVSAPVDSPFGAAVGISARSGPDRGLSLVGCSSASSDQWIPGVRSNADERAELILTNLDASEAAVDVSVFGPSGRLPAPGSRGIVVGPNSQRVVSLSPIVSAAEPVALRVATSSGRVVAVVRQTSWRDNTPVGGDWLATTPEPSQTAVIAGIPDGAGARDLVVVNPGNRTAQVTIDVLGVAGMNRIASLESIDVPAGTTRVVALERGLTAAAGALRLTSEQRFTASLLVGNGGGDKSSDFTAIPATSALPATGIWALPWGADATAVLALANLGDTQAVAQVRVGTKTQRLTIPAGAFGTLALTDVDARVVAIETDSRALYAAVTAEQVLGDVRGVAVLTLRAATVKASVPDLRYDPQVGS